MGVKYGSLALTLKTLSSRFFGIPDLQRWKELDNYDPRWDERTKLLAKLIPKGTRVIEFGAGRRQLELYMDASCTYFPSDLVSRGEGTIICNLNDRPLPDLTDMQLDVAVLGGVLEYIRDLHSFAAWLSQQVPTCIVSYVCARSQPHTSDRIKEVIKRTRCGWVNTYTQEELEQIFKANGFLHMKKITEQTIYGEEYLFVLRR